MWGWVLQRDTVCVLPCASWCEAITILFYGNAESQHWTRFGRVALSVFNDPAHFFRLKLRDRAAIYAWSEHIPRSRQASAVKSACLPARRTKPRGKLLSHKLSCPPFFMQPQRRTHNPHRPTLTFRFDLQTPKQVGLSGTPHCGARAHRSNGSTIVVVA